MKNPVFKKGSKESINSIQININQINNNQINPSSLLIFMGWIMYTISYFGKVNYSANISQIVDYYHVTKSEAGLAPTFLFFAYGIGQVVNGILCRKYNMKWAIFGSLMVSAFTNLSVAITPDFKVVKWLWLINGFALSVLWPTLVRLQSETLHQKRLTRATVIMGTPVSIGTLMIYALSSIYALFGNFKLAFYTAAIAQMSVAVLWILLYKKAVETAKSEKAEELPMNGETIMMKEKVPEKPGEGKVFIVSVCVLCFCAIGVNIIKDGLTTWLPSILKDEYSMTASLSILLTVLLPVVAVIGNSYAMKMHKKIPDYVTHCFVVFP